MPRRDRTDYRPMDIYYDSPPDDEIAQLAREYVQEEEIRGTEIQSDWVREQIIKAFRAGYDRAEKDAEKLFQELGVKS
jgi:Pyruvate/2-oxoacid:ferredoxin oxidoreductase gamma subunit